jgi:hypothetical protein
MIHEDMKKVLRRVSSERPSNGYSVSHGCFVVDVLPRYRRREQRCQFRSAHC